MASVLSCDANGMWYTGADEYIAPTATAGWQGRPHTTLPTTLDNDLQGVGKRLRNKRDVQHLRTFALDRNQQHNINQEIMKAAQAKLDPLIVRQQLESVIEYIDITLCNNCPTFRSILANPRAFEALSLAS